MKKIFLILFGLVFLAGSVLGYSSYNYATSYPGGNSFNYNYGTNVNLYYSYDSNQCDAGQDFVIQVAPFGCSPAVVRSDLLEEQNVPVFCQLAATKINPLIDVEAIDYISFNGDYPQEVSGVGFHPARAAVKNSRQTLLNSPVLENIGYAVIVLKQQPVESEMPDVVEGTLTARIKYDIENAFGVGQATYYLPVLTDDEWNENYKRYSFWDGRGYLRADSIEDGRATISIYQDVEDEYTTSILNVGETSNEITIPGFYCRAEMQVKLTSLENPDTRAKLNINGEIVEVSRGEKFLDNLCTINNIKKNGDMDEVEISCKTDTKTSERFTLKYAPRVSLTVNGVSGDYELGSEIGGGIYLIDLKKENDKYVVYFGDKANSIKTASNSVIAGETKSISLGAEVGFNGISSPQDVSLEGNALNYYNNAMEDYSELFNALSAEKENENSQTTFGEQALAKSIELSFNVGQRETALRLCSEFNEKYPDSTLSLSKCGDELKLSSTGVSSYNVDINGVSKSISFEGIYEPDFEDYGAVVLLSKDNYRDQFNLEKGKDYSSENGEVRIQLTSLEEESAKLNVNYNDGEKAVTKSYDLNLNTPVLLDNGYSLLLDKVNLNKFAKVSLVPRIENSYSEANFSYKISIEKRAIQLSPDQLENKISILDENIAKWEKISENLGTAVKGFKAACLSTGAILTVTNFIDNLDGEAIARQEVMRGDNGWVNICKEEIKRTGGSLNSCLLDHNDDIERDVEALNSAMNSIGEINDDTVEQSSQRIQNLLEGKSVSSTDGKTTIELNENSEVLKAISKEGYEEGTVSLREMRDIETYANVINSASASAELKKMAEQNLYSTLSDVKETSANFAAYTSTKQEIANAGLNLGTTSYGEKDAIRGVYSGGALLGSQISGAEGLEPSKNYPAEVVTLNGKKYLAVLEETNNGYSATKFYEYNGVSGNGVSVGADVTNDVGNKFSTFKQYDRTSYQNAYKDAEVKYFETEPYKGLPAIVPFDLRNGWYAATKQTISGFGNIASYDDSGKISSFYLCNVGQNGRAEFESGIGDDICQVFNPGTGQIYGEFPGMDSSETNRIVRQAMSAVQEAASKYKAGLSGYITINGERVRVGEPAANVPDIQCSDFMSPQECQLLFNVCDPVICPSSRCDLGGSYPVDDVVQSGIVGSLALCLPNYEEGIAVPVCLTGVKAGVDGLLSISQNYRDCLQENLESGETIGICDEIHSIYLCEFFWKQAVPFTKLIIPKILEAATGQLGSRGGGEYLGVASAWENAEKSVDYFTQYYGANSFEAFQARSTDETGSFVCKNFISARYPSSGDFFDALIEPDSPSQYHAWFQETPYTSATVPAVSQYKVFYHIYAGKDQGVYYKVYLRSPQGTSYYSTSDTITIATGYIPKGDYASETKDFTGVAGYRDLCINVNGKDECGFQQVTTSFALDYLADMYAKEQASQKDITTESACVSGTASAYSLIQPNVQAGVEDVLNPQLYNKGIIRVCSTDMPGENTGVSSNNVSRWEEVGFCGDEEIKCWLDTQSVKDVIQSTNLEGQTLEEVGGSTIQSLLNEGQYITDFSSEIEKINDLNSEGKTTYLTDSYIAKALFNSQKAQLYFIRGVAYDELAVNAYNVWIAQRIADQYETDDEGVAGGVEEPETPTEEEPEGTPTGDVVNCRTLTSSSSENLIVEFKDCITADMIDSRLSNSPAKGTGKTFYDLGKQYNVDPIFALAFFNQESSFGTAGVARQTKSIGNIRYTSNCPGTNYNGYCSYSSWEEGIESWYKLISSNTYVGQGLDSVEKIIPKYAPASDGNNPAAYISNIRNFVLNNRISS